MDKTLNGIIRECAERLLDEQHSVTVDEIVECACRQYPAVVAFEKDRLALRALTKVAKDFMRDQSNDDESPQQARLPGIDIATALAIPEGGGEFRYVRSDKAVVAELKAGEIVRVQNVQRAVASLDRYRASVERLLPFFIDEHTTVREAYEAWRAAQQAAS